MQKGTSCPHLLQVFFAEWIDFETNMTASIWPRISAYSNDTLKDIFTIARDPDKRLKVSA